VNRRFKSTTKQDLIDSIKRSIKGKEGGLKNTNTPKYTKIEMKEEIKTLKWASEILELVLDYEQSDDGHDQLMQRVGKRFPNV